MQKNSTTDYIPLLLPVLDAERLRRFQRIRLMLSATVVAFTTIAGILWLIQKPMHFAQATTERTILCIDLSYSMLARDAQWLEQSQVLSRIEQAKHIATEIITTHPTSEFALVVFAGESALLSPFSTHTQTLLDLIHSIAPGHLDTRGSSLVSALRILADRFPAVAYQDCALSAIIISDGDMLHDDRALAVRTAEQWEHPIHTIILGNETPYTLRLEDSTQITTQRRTAMMQEIAERTNASTLLASEYTSTESIVNALSAGIGSAIVSWSDSLLHTLHSIVSFIINQPLVCIGGIIVLLLLIDMLLLIFFRSLTTKHSLGHRGQYRNRRSLKTILSHIVGKAFFLLIFFSLLASQMYGQSYLYEKNPFAIAHSSITHEPALQQALETIRQQQYVQALAQLTEISEHSSSTTQKYYALHYRALIFCAQGNFQNAFSDGMIILNESSESALIQATLPLIAECGYRTQRYQQAIMACMQALRIMPNHTRLKRILSLCYVAQAQSAKQMAQTQQEQITTPRSIEEDGRSALRAMQQRKRSKQAKGID